MTDEVEEDIDKALFFCNNYDNELKAILDKGGCEESIYHSTEGFRYADWLLIIPNSEGGAAFVFDENPQGEPILLWKNES